MERSAGTAPCRAVGIHQKEGREHCHIVWSRIDLVKMRAISDSHNYRKHEEVARDLEREFGHARVQGAHAERDGKPRPDRTPSHSEMLQADRGAVSPQDAKALITEIWRRTDSGQSFKAGLEDRGWLLARGDRRDFVAVDPQCGTHSLARRVEGGKAKDIRNRMADLDPELCPPLPRPAPCSGNVRMSRRLSDPLKPSRSTTRWPMPKPNGRRRSGNLQADREDARMLRNNPAVPPTPERAFGNAAREQAQGIRNERREEQFWEQQKAWRVSVNEQNPDKIKPADKGLQVVDSATGAVSRLGDFVVNILSGSSAKSQDRPADMKAFVSDPAARKEQQLARLGAKRATETADKALENIREDMQAGRNLKSEDIKSLTRQHQKQIRQFGDSAVRQMVEEAQRRNEQYWKGNERER